MDDPTTRKLKMLGWLLHGAGLFALLAVGLATCYFVYLPLAKKEGACVARITVVDRLLDNSREIRAAHSRIEESLATIQRRIDTLRQRIPETLRESEFLEEMNRVATDEHLEIRDFNRGAVTVKDTHSEVEVRIQCVGTYPEICRFLDRLASLRRISSIEKLTIASDSAVEAYPVDLTLRLYYGLQERPAGKRKALNV